MSADHSNPIEHLPPGAEALPDARARVPALIVGSGACGLVAALVLANLGVDCLLLDRDASPSGSSSLSSGFIPAAGTQAQRALRIDDSAERFAADIQTKASQRAAPHLVQSYTQAIAPALDFLQGHHGLEWEVLDSFLYPGHSRHRMHRLRQRTGTALMAALLESAQAQSISLLTQATARQLLVDKAGCVRGLRIERPDGATETIACEALLLACNGFGGAAALRSRFLPALAHAPFAGHGGNDGSAVLWGEALGARLADMAACQGHGGWAVPHGILITWAVMTEGGVQVNSLGERFHDESRGYSEAAAAVLGQPGGLAWCVFDEPILALARGFPDFAQAESVGAVRHAKDIESLAQIIGCHAEALSLSLSAARPDSVDPFGRRFGRSLRAPFSAVRVTGALFHTQGGLDIDDQCRVLRGDGTLIEGLWAAGGAARGVSGDRLEGYLSGNGLLSAVAGGWLAAHSVVASLRSPGLGVPMRPPQALPVGPCT